MNMTNCAGTMTNGGVNVAVQRCSRATTTGDQNLVVLSTDENLELVKADSGTSR